MPLSNTINHSLACPKCKSSLVIHESNAQCSSKTCSVVFPIHKNIPILINNGNSVFTIDEFLNEKNTFFDLSEKGIISFIKKNIPNISLSIVTKKNYSFLEALLLEKSQKPKVLVIGGSIIGNGMETFIHNKQIDFIETDISFGPRTQIICDSHDLPFLDSTFDCVIAQAVLEHVIDPYRCVEEIYRVLKPEGIVYAETPFMQQVHGGKYDFTRFTHLGYRRLFRRFEGLKDGSCGGAGMALTWSIRYFFLSFFTNNTIRSAVKLILNFLTFWIKYFDYLTIYTRGTLDAASGYYFMGKKKDTVLSDTELLKSYKGLF